MHWLCYGQLKEYRLLLYPIRAYKFFLSGKININNMKCYKEMEEVMENTIIELCTNETA